MKTSKSTQKKIEYDRIVKLVREAKKDAEKFIQKSKANSSSIQFKYF